jgi:YD repeat-containing protein
VLVTTPHQAVRTLASPGFVLALVVLVLNDHVLKQAYPGWVTGKLSDVAGLVVAPLLLAVPLTLLRVPRALLIGIALTGLGFTLTKTSAAGAAITSDLWSLTGIPTHIRADVTDLLALPALYAAWLVDRRVVRRQPADWRSAMAFATGLVMLPLTVLSTAATSCDEPDTVQSVVRATLPFTPSDKTRETRLVVGIDFRKEVSLDATGRLTRLTDADRDELDRLGRTLTERTCDGAGTCWRIGDAEERTVDVSHDDGRTWETEYQADGDEVEAELPAPGPVCRKQTGSLRGLGVLTHAGVSWVVVGAGAAGLLLRSPDGDWRLVTMSELQRLPEP